MTCCTGEPFSILCLREVLSRGFVTLGVLGYAAKNL